MAKTDLLTGDVRALTLKIAAPSVAAMLAASVCPLLEALVLSVRDASLSAAIGASLALILLEQTVGFTLGMGAGSFVSRCIGQGRREAARCAAHFLPADEQDPVEGGVIGERFHWMPSPVPFW